MAAILFSPLIVIIVIVAATAIYFLAYKKRINRQISDSGIKQRKMTPPWRFAIIVIIVALAGLSAFMAVLSLRYFENPGDEVADEYYEATYDFMSYSPDEMSQGYLSAFSMDSNAGYTKDTVTDNDVRFTYFIRNDDYNTYHPSFIVYAEYIGDKAFTSYDIDGKFLTDTEGLIIGRGWGGADKDAYLAVLGNASIDCVFSLTVSYYDIRDRDIEGDVIEGAAVQGNLTISIPPPEREDD